MAGLKEGFSSIACLMTFSAALMGAANIRALFRGHHALPRSLEQRIPESFPQAREQVAHRGLAQVDATRGAAHTSFDDQGFEAGKQIQI